MGHTRLRLRKVKYTVRSVFAFHERGRVQEKTGNSWEQDDAKVRSGCGCWCAERSNQDPDLVLEVESVSLSTVVHVKIKNEKNVKITVHDCTRGKHLLHTVRARVAHRDRFKPHGTLVSKWPLPCLFVCVRVFVLCDCTCSCTKETSTTHQLTLPSPSGACCSL